MFAPPLGFSTLLADVASSAPATAAAVAADSKAEPLISDPAGVLAVLFAVLGVIFWLTQHPVVGRLFKVVPALVFCYFVPTTLTTLGVIPDSSPLYSWVKQYVLPASLLLLILSLDLPGIIRLGPKAGIMLLAGTFGVVIGGPLSLLICESMLPPDAWKGMAALAGSWIGGGANFVAIGDMAGASDTMLATMVIPDVFVASIWMGVLLYFAGIQHRIDRWTGANTQAIRDLERSLSDFQERVNRVATLPDLIIIVAFGFVGSWLSYKAGAALPEITAGRFGTIISHSTWKYILITSVGVLLSLTRVRNLEGAGASKIGSVMIYLLVTCIGASADFTRIAEQPAYLLMGFIWIAIHIVVLLSVGWFIKAPIFFIAVGSQSNIGGAASAPVVAAAYHPALAPVGALLAVAGYVLGTYAGLVCMQLLKWVAGAA
ncbi:MAG: DUF819 family protein [Planctomycetes bacterium]|nr:DUF819 family protein [Planctomycetota bacterium]